MAYLVKKPDKKQSIQEANAAGLVTFEKFYEIVEENVKTNLLDGKIIRDSPPVPKHALIVTWLGRLTGDYAEIFDLGSVLEQIPRFDSQSIRGRNPTFFLFEKVGCVLSVKNMLMVLLIFASKLYQKRAANAIVAESLFFTPITASKNIGLSTPCGLRWSFTKTKTASGPKSSQMSKAGYARKFCPTSG